MFFSGSSNSGGSSTWRINGSYGFNRSFDSGRGESIAVCSSDIAVIMEGGGVGSIF